jgi:hypothetical protein
LNLNLWTMLELLKLWGLLELDWMHHFASWNGHEALGAGGAMLLFKETSFNVKLTMGRFVMVNLD